MRENEGAQLELFNEGDAARLSLNTPNSFFGFVRGYEKVAILLILFIACAIAFYSLGFEKGKKLAAVMPPIQPAERFETAQSPKPELPVIYPLPPQQPPSLLAAEKKKFTIQLASFKNKAAALKEAAALKKKGLQPLVLSKGSFIILCVGNFSDKNNANQTLSLLKRKYQDSYVRRL